VVLGLLAPGAAAGSTYCVATSGSDCYQNYSADGVGLQQAINDADTNVDISGTTTNTVRIGAGTFTKAGGFQTAGGTTSIVGAGQDTVLTGTGQANEIVLGAPQGSPEASVSKLRVDLTGTSASGIEGFLRVSDVRVGGSGSALDAAVRLPPGGRLSRAVIDPAKIRGNGVFASTGFVEDTVIRVHKDLSGYAFAIALGPADGTTGDMTLRHVTVVGDGTPGSEGVLDQALASNVAATTLNVTLRDSVLHGLDIPLDRFGVAKGAKAYDGTANIDYRYSSLDASRNQSTGPGATTPGMGNLADPDPLFAADLSLRAGSPLIDMGDPAGPEAGDSPTDVAGSPRIIGTRRDIGAFEYVPPAGPGPGGPAPGPTGPVVTPGPSDRAAPVISTLALSNRRFRVGAEATAVSAAATRLARLKRPPRGTTISFTLSTAATVTLRIDRQRAGHVVRRRRGGPAVCVPKTKRKAIARTARCVIYAFAGVLTRNSAGGPQSVVFSGRIGRRALPPAAYRLTALATDSAGNTSPPRTAFFTVVR
jgi:hypothetical protein